MPYEPKGTSLSTLEHYDSFSFTTAALGGYWDGSLAWKSSQEEVDEWIDSGLARHIEIHDESQNLIWEGFVNKVSANLGQFSVDRGPLMDIANKVQVAYSSIDPGPPLVDNGKTVTAAVEDLDSQALYGIREVIYDAGSVTDAEADQIAQLYLEANSYPKTTKDFSSGGSGEVSLSIELLGYVHWLNYPYTNDATGGEDLSTKLGKILTAEPNGLFSTTNAVITPNTFQVQAEEVEYRTGWELIERLVSMGDFPNNNRYTFGVYGNRRVYYEPIVNEITYQQRLADPNQRVETLGGQEVRPWNVRPGKWLFFPDFLVGRTPADPTIPTDPRLMLIEQVTFSSPYSVSISQSPVDKLSQKLEQLARSQDRA